MANPTYDYEHPCWGPLEAAAPPEVVDDFMWMHAIITPTGERIEAYKHRLTRQYLLLDHDGQAYTVELNEHVRPVSPDEAVARAMTPPRRPQRCNRSRCR